MKKGDVPFKGGSELSDSGFDSSDVQPVNFLSRKKPQDDSALVFGEDVGSHDSKPQFSTMGKSINSFVLNSREHQVCAQKDAKNLTTATEIKTVAGESPHPETKSKLVQFAWWMKKQGYSENTITRRAKILATLSKRGAELLSPETVKETIAKQDHWKPKTKELAAEAYSCYLDRKSVV